MFQKTNGQTNFFMDLDLSKAKKKKMDSSWASCFFELIFKSLLKFETRFQNFYDSIGRPNLSVAVLLGILILKNEMDLTDENAVEQFNFNLLWHKALGVSTCDANICRKTLYNFERKLLHSGKDSDLFNEITGSIIQAANLKLNHQRMDSVHLSSNMAHLGRARLMSRTMEVFLKQLRSKCPDRFKDVSEEMVKKYLEREGYFCDPKPSESHRKSLEIAADIYVIVKGYETDEVVRELKGYKLLERVLLEHSKVEGTKLELIKAGSDSLQNPSDPDATFSGHKGKGYQMQTTETCNEANPFEVITSLKVEGAHESDQNAVQPMINQLESVDRLPEELTGDGGLGSQANVDYCKEHGVDLQAPVAGKEPDVGWKEFEFNNETGEMVSCPNNQKPAHRQFDVTTETWEACFDSATQCVNCPKQSKCPGKILKTGQRKFRWTVTDARIAIRRKYQKTEEFKQRYKIRSGIEATFSQLKNTHGAERLAVRGHPMVTFVMTLKCTALNVHRYLKYHLSRNKNNSRSICVTKYRILQCPLPVFFAFFAFGGHRSCSFPFCVIGSSGNSTFFENP